MSTLRIIDALPSGLDEFCLDYVKTFTPHTQEEDDLKYSKDNVMGWLIEITPSQSEICNFEKNFDRFTCLRKRMACNHELLMGVRGPGYHSPFLDFLITYPILPSQFNCIVHRRTVLANPPLSRLCNLLVATGILQGCIIPEQSAFLVLRSTVIQVLEDFPFMSTSLFESLQRGEGRPVAASISYLSFTMVVVISPAIFLIPLAVLQS